MYSDVTKELTQSDLDLLQKKIEPVSDPGVLHVYFIVINTLQSKYWDNWNTIPINRTWLILFDVSDFWMKLILMNWHFDKKPKTQIKQQSTFDYAYQ